jgi:hypothetical protein
MGDLSERDVEDVLEGVQPPGRDDLAPVVQLTTWMHASREIEPPPAMRDYLFLQIEEGPDSPQRSSRRSPAHLGRRRSGVLRLVPAPLRSSARPIASVAAAAAMLVGVIIAVRASGPEPEAPAVAFHPAMGSRAAGDAEATTGTAPSTTTSGPEAELTWDPPSSATAVPPPAVDPPAAAAARDGATAVPDTTLVPEGPVRRAGTTTPTNAGGREPGSEDDLDESGDYSDDRRANAPDEPQSLDEEAPDPPWSWWPSLDSSLLGAAEDSPPPAEADDPEYEGSNDDESDLEDGRD